MVALLIVGARYDVSVLASASPLSSQSSTPQKSTPTQSRTQKLANPLNDLLDEAQHDIDANQFEAALTPLQKFLAEKPDIAWAHFQLAYAYTALKRPDEARTEYERATALDPKMSEAFLNLGILLSEKDPAAAVPPLRRAVDLLPAQSRPRFLLGHALERSGDIPGAVESYEAALRLDPRDVETAIHLGNLYVGLKRYPDAETKFRAALELEPKSPQALLGLAQTLDAQKKPEAAAAYRDYLAVQPNTPGAESRAIHLLIEQKQYDAALAELDRADAGKPPTLDSLRSRADIQIAQKKWDDSIVTLRKAIALTPNDAELHGGLGRVYLQKRDFASAEKELKSALQLDKNNLVYWKDLRTTYYLGGNFPATLATQDLIAKVETPGPGEWFIRALCYDKLNQPKPALEAYEKFLELDQDKNPDQVWQAQQRSKVLRRMLDQKR
jgi:tetratricopeptide (TPR) repeat protein